MDNKMSTNVKNFKDLIVWQKAKHLQQQIYNFQLKLPYYERDNLRSQILRSSSSISANIAEGGSQLYKRKEITHYNIALGSTAETRNWLDYALSCNYITQQEFDKMDNEAFEITKMLFSLIKKLKKEIESNSNS